MWPGEEGRRDQVYQYEISQHSIVSIGSIQNHSSVAVLFCGNIEYRPHLENLFSNSSSKSSQENAENGENRQKILELKSAASKVVRSVTATDIKLPEYV